MQDPSDARPECEPATVVIPAPNEAKHILPVLETLSQVKETSEVIVVDDASTGDTADVVRSYKLRDPRLKLLSPPMHQGKGGAMLAGAEASICDLIVFLDADLVYLRPELVSA